MTKNHWICYSLPFGGLEVHTFSNLFYCTRDLVAYCLPPNSNGRRFVTLYSLPFGGLEVHTFSNLFYCTRDLVAYCLPPNSNGRRFVTLYRWQESRPSSRKRNAKWQNDCLRRFTNSFEKKRSERQRRKGKIFPFECRLPKNTQDR